MQIFKTIKINDKKIQELLKDESHNLWEKYNKRRLYLDWAKLINLEIHRYKTGNISISTLAGEKISNTKAFRYSRGKAYISLNTNILACVCMHPEMIELLENALQLSIGANNET
tara:strand:- start:165 stop:506 length:342 start_codon:yes stop_codon:yes gene_type:complete